jgi:hypothetical protein
VGTRSVWYSPETGVLLDAEAITDFLQARLQPGDRILLTDPSTPQLWYSFWRHGLLEAEFHPDSGDIEATLKLIKADSSPFGPLEDSGQRAVIVVNRSYGETLKDVLTKVKFPDSGWSNPREFREFEAATLYLAHRMP